MKTVLSFLLAILIVLTVVMIMASASEVFGQTGALAPNIYPVFNNVNGITPAALGFVCTTSSGTTIPLATYREFTNTTANQNPIRLNSSGRAVNGSTLVPIFLSGSLYRFALYAAGTGNTCNSVTVGAKIWEMDNVYDFGALLASGLIQFTTINNRQFCASGANFGVKYTNAVALLPSTGGIVDCSNLQGAQIINTSDPFTGVTKPVTLIWPTGTATSSISLAIPATTSIEMLQSGLLSMASGFTATVSGEIYGSDTQHFTGSGNVLFALGSKTTAGPLQWWGGKADYTAANTDNGPPCTKATASGLRRIIWPGGLYGFSSPCTWTTSNWMYEGDSRVYTDLYPISANISVAGGPDAIFVNNINVTNAVIENFRFSSLVAFAGFAIWAEENGNISQALFSTIFRNIWVSMGTGSTGFFHGAPNDCFFDTFDIENTSTVFELYGVGIGTSTFTNFHTTSNTGNLILSTHDASTGMIVRGVQSFTQQGGNLIEITNGQNWQISDIFWDFSGFTPTTAGTMVTVSTCTACTITNFVAGRTTGHPSALSLTTFTGTVSNGIITNMLPDTQNVLIAGVSNIDMVNVASENAAGIDFNITGSGDVRLDGIRSKKSLSYALIDTALASANITVKNSEFTNSAYNGAAIPAMSLNTTGRAVAKNNLFIWDDTASKISGFTQFGGTGTGAMLESNTYVGGPLAAKPIAAAGSTQTYSSRRSIVLGVSASITSGFGTPTPTIVGDPNGFAVTVGATTGTTTGVASWTFSFPHVPICVAENSTTANTMRAQANASSVTITGTMAPADVINITCTEYGIFPTRPLAILTEWLVGSLIGLYYRRRRLAC